MRSRTILLVGALLAGTASPGHAQSVGKMLEYDIRNGVVDMVAVWATPFRGSGRDWLATAGYLAAGAAISPFDDDIDRWFVRHQDASAWSVLKELRQGGVAFSGKTITPVVGGLYVIGLATKSEAIRDGVWGCASSWASSSVVRNYVLYQAIGRVRPDSSKTHPNGYVAPPAEQGDQYEFDAFPGGGKSKWGVHSFPGGHVANIAACAGFLGKRFDNKYVEPIALLLTAGVGVGRMVDRRHWASDTFLGIIYGYAIGREVGRRSLHRRQEQASQSASATSPSEGFYIAPGGRGVTIGMQWTF